VTSLFDLIREQQRVDPNRALDYGKFPEPTFSGASMYAPGAFDAVSDRFDEKSDKWPGIVALIARFRAGDVIAAQLEISLSSIQAAPNVNEVFRHLTADDVPDEVARAFWAIAKRSREYEAVKWGIAIGTARFSDDMVPDLLTFARHAEFSRFALIALKRAGVNHPEIRSYLPLLLPVMNGWGIAHMIDEIVRDKAQLAQLEVIRSVAVYGVENSEGLLVEFGHVIARHLSPEAFELACSDSRLFVAIVLLMEEILTTDHPLHRGILDVPNSTMLVDAYVRLLASRKPDVWLLQGLKTARSFFNDPECPLEDREARKSSIDVLLEERISGESFDT
jgi:hypothetical protein